MNELTITTGFGTLQSFELAQLMAKCLSASTLVPVTYQGEKGIPNCVIALNMAHRMGADPLMVMQNLYVVQGRPSWSAQFLISTFNACGRFSAIRYKFWGTVGQDNYGCSAYAVEKDSGEILEGAVVTIDLAKKEGWYAKNGSKWQTMPQQMLMYRAASWFVRAYAPEIAMGLHTADEVEDGGFGEDYTPHQEITERANREVIDIPGAAVSVEVTPAAAGTTERRKPTF